MPEIAKVIKSLSSTELQLEPGSRTVVACISTDDIDRDKEVVLPKGMRKKAFQGNPVVFQNHDYYTLPIGKCLWVKADDKRVLAKYQVSDKTDEANEVWGLMQDGILQAHSIGFQSLDGGAPTESELRKRPDWAGCRYVHRDWELLEFSVVGIPCNPEAMALAVSKGYSAGIIAKLFGPKPEPQKVRTLSVNEVMAAMANGLSKNVSALSLDETLADALNLAAGHVR